MKSDQETGQDSTAGLSRDTVNANQTVENTFNLQKVQNDLAFGQAFGKVATFAVAEAAGKLADSSPEMKALFGEGGAGRDAMHAAVAAIGAALSGGNVAGAAAGSLAGDVLQSLAQPIIDQAAEQLPVEAQPAARNALNEVVATAGGYAAGALAGGGGQGALAGAGAGINNERFNRQLHPEEYARAKKDAKIVAEKLGISVQDAEGRIVAEILRNSDKQTAEASGGKHDYEIRSIVGCQNLNCDGYKNDPQYANHDFNSQYIARNQSAYDLGQKQISTGLTYDGLVASNYDKDPLGNTIARAGGSLLAGSVAGGLVAAWGVGTAFTYAGDAFSYQYKLSPDQPSYKNTAIAGGVAAGMSPLLLPLDALGSASAGKIAVGIYDSLVGGVGAFGTTAMTNPSGSPNLSAGIGTASALFGMGGKTILPGPIGNAFDIWMQILPGPAQAVIEQNNKKGK
ncbi:hypothetical protein [Trinickia mobilis]|uniref:hypothetical protein n=1 Tax=Trinickia mobilis TaxID=2816356 RepID=UPI0035ABAE46